MKYDIFISYKRKGASSATAAYLYEILLQKGYNVFFDRKEMRSGKFNEQLLEHISNATDIIILLEEESLGSWFNYRSRKKDRSIESDLPDEPYKTDWFCREIMHALSLEGKNIIPILLNGYSMPEGKDLPPEMAELSLHNALSLEISDAPEFYEKYFVEQGYLKSKPANLSLARNYQSKGGLVGCFLFYTEVESCDLFECGEKIASLTDDDDEWHPFRYPVNFAGEHRFKAINNDSCDTVTIRCSVDTYCQQYVQIQFSDNRNLWELTQEDIDSHDDADQLYKWGLGLFDGTPKHEPDIARSFECLNKAISLGHQEALSFVSSQGTGLISQKKAAKEVAIKWYTIAAENGNTDAQFNLGHAYHNGEGVEQDYGKAIEWFSKAAEQGDSQAQSNLGGMYRFGIGVEQDYGKAIEWYSKAVEKGNSRVQIILGSRYRKGYRVEQDYAKAIEWYSKAAEQGDSLAQIDLGNMYLKGEGVEQDYGKAIEWYSKAAEQGDSQAQINLGYMYCEGKGVEQDYGKAIEWYSKAAEQGNKRALNSLAWIYHLMGDYEKALPWAEKAIEARPDDPNVIDTLATVYEDLNRYDEALVQFERCLKLYEENGDEEGKQRTIEKIKALKEKDEK